MNDNIINLLACGNQELFHSAFLAWLLDAEGSHGFRDRFYRNLRPHLGEAAAHSDYDDVLVEREFSSSDARFDILLKPKTGSQRNGIVLENKTKSFGAHAQLEKYRRKGFDVVGIALLLETFDSDSRSNFNVVTYSSLIDILKSFQLEKANGYHFLVEQYIQFVGSSLRAFDLIRQLGEGKVAGEDFTREFVVTCNSLGINQNDVRLFNYYYYVLLTDYLTEHSPDLLFGNADYNQENKSTKWLSYKDMQGPPYMQCLIEFPWENNDYWQQSADFESQFPQLKFQICPRIEVWFEPSCMMQTAHIGRLLLGTWSRPITDFVSSNEPFKSTFKRVGSRNFHGEPLAVADLRFEEMANRIRHVLSHFLVSTKNE